MEPLTPTDHAEKVALFRSVVIGALASRELERGELRAALVQLSRQKFVPPEQDRSRNFSVPTLERWYYAYREGGMSALRPKARSDRGRARELTPEQRELLCEVRREYPSASAEMILRTLVADGRLQQDAISPATLRRLYAEKGLDRVAIRNAESHTRRRWQAEHPGLLWHADVCHGPSVLIAGKAQPVRVHAILDDASRYVVAIEAHHTEREVEMLGLLVRALRKQPAPDILYLDNGSTYRGEVLRLACERLGISLVHAKPHDAPARGKMERFWRTLRQGCLDVLGNVTSLHDVNVRLLAFVDQHYHRAPHGGLLGRAPGDVWTGEERYPPEERITEHDLRKALTVRERRRVRRDTTLDVDGKTFELAQGFFAGRVVTVVRSWLDPTETPHVEHEGKRYDLHPVNPVRNGKARRAKEAPPPAKPAVRFDPAGALVNKAVGRKEER
jgi:transposase InsO family protein